MHLMKNIKIGTKLIISFCLVNTLFCGGILALIISYHLSHQRLITIDKNVVIPMAQASELHVTIAEAHSIVFHMLSLDNDSPGYIAADQDRTYQQSAIHALIDTLYICEASPRTRALLSDALSYYENTYAVSLYDLLSRSKNEDPEAIAADAPRIHAMGKEFSGLMAAVHDQMMDERLALVSESDSKLSLVYIICAIGFPALMGLVVFVIRKLRLNISIPIVDMAVVAEKIAVGDLDVSIHKRSDEDEIGKLIHSFHAMTESIRQQSELITTVADGNLAVQYQQRSDKDTLGHSIQQMIDNLTTLLRNVQNSSAQVASASHQISDGAQNLASGATEQAATIERLSSIVSEVQDQAVANNGMTLEVLQKIEAASKMMDESNVNMRQMTATMQVVSKGSQNIAKVIRVIDEIAFQTNLLALNAAVEAAQAGQHGKGFAVVAAEVKALASKSAVAAEEISALIETSVRNANEGSSVAIRTSESLDKVIEIASSIFDIMGKQSSSSQRQNEAISDIHKSIEALSVVIQQNSATAQENAAASEEMNAQATLLSNATEQFQLRQTALNAPPQTYSLESGAYQGTTRY